MRSLLSRLFFLSVALIVVVAVALAWVLQTPLKLSHSPLDVEISAGSSMRQVARTVVAAGVDINPWLLEAMARVAGHQHKVKAGSYEFVEGLTAIELLNKLVRGDASQSEFVLVEGWNFRRVRAELAKLPGLKLESAELSDAGILERLGSDAAHPEGLFLPDTYFYTRGSSDIALLARAYRAMQNKLARAWAVRDPSVPLASPYEALIMASLVEKETGIEADRMRVASVFFNRLARGMSLQTDPTVIYGLGENFSGNLRKADLLADTPYNTYTRSGLPPTPIAMPGAASINAVLHPPQTDLYFFVSRGDGSSEFSRTLDEHNRAVARYVLKKKGQ
ncbi:MAG: endolytic transglycosylase MltG [Betaproteobacteria bacterium]|nr:endolytic transglycosylase MltG [Betaproteobacteria bacterium]